MKGFLKGATIGSIDTEGPAPDTRPAKIFEGFVFPEMLQNHVLKNLPPDKCVEQAAEKARKLVA
jgi:multiple sugar transport system substrate-binding protein